MDETIVFKEACERLSPSDEDMVRIEKNIIEKYEKGEKQKKQLTTVFSGAVIITAIIVLVWLATKR